MAEMTLRDLSPELLERLQTAAAERRCEPEALALDLLKQALGLSPRVPVDLSRITEVLRENETSVLTEAIAALEKLPDDNYVNFDNPPRAEPA